MFKSFEQKGVKIVTTKKTVTVTTETYSNLKKIIKVFTENGLKVQSEHSEGTHIPRVIADAVPKQEYPGLKVFNQHRYEMSDHDTQRTFSIRSASIHPDMICYNMHSKMVTDNRVKDNIATISVLTNLEIYKNGTWGEQTGFFFAFVQIIDSVIQLFSSISIKRVSILEIVVKPILDSFDWLIDHIQKAGAGDSIFSAFDQDASDMTFMNVLAHYTSSSFLRTLSFVKSQEIGDAARDAGLEIVQQGTHFAVDPVQFIANLLPDKFLGIEEFSELAERILSCFWNPFQVFFFLPYLKRTFLNMYNRWDRKRLQKLRQHTLTYAPFVRYLFDDQNTINQILRLKTYEEKKEMLSIQLLKMQPSQKFSYFTTIIRTYYKECHHKCFIHTKMRCSECNKMTLSWNEAIDNICVTLKRAEWGYFDDSDTLSDKKLLLLQQRVDTLTYENNMLKNNIVLLRPGDSCFLTS